MQSVSSRIWTRIAVFISYGDNDYTTGTSTCDIWLSPKFRGCRYETIEEMKEAVTKVINTLTQKDLNTYRRVHFLRW